MLDQVSIHTYSIEDRVLLPSRDLQNLGLSSAECAECRNADT